MFAVNDLKQNYVVTELEQRLKNDKSGAALGEIEAQLSQWTGEVEAAKKAGLPPQKFFQVDRLLSSLRVSNQVVRRTWNHFHTR